MAKTSNTTLLADLIDPQVIADEIEQKLIDGIRFAPLAEVDNTLVGKAGDEITFPSYEYVGMAEDVEEGADIPIAKLSTDTAKVKVSKIGRAIQFTDEALLAGNENSVASESAKQAVIAINDKVEAKLLKEMSDKAALKATVSASGNVTHAVAEALALFGEDIDGFKVLICTPSFYTRLLKSDGWIPNTETGANIIIRGAVGQFYGCQVVVSNRLAQKTYAVTTDETVNPQHTYFEKKGDSYIAVKNVAEDATPKANGWYEVTSTTNEAYIIKQGALRIVFKRGTLVEFDRDKIDQTNYVIASKLFAPYLYDKTKLIKLTIE